MTMIFIMLVAFGDDERTSVGRSGMVQGAGYSVAATGPLLLGALHEATAGWTVPLLVELVAVLLFLVPGALVARRFRGHAAG